MFRTWWVFSFLCSVAVNAAQPGPVRTVNELEEAIADAPPLAAPTPVPEKRRANLFGTLNDQQLLLVGVRIDAAYTGGGAVVQGFTIPSVRLTAWGRAGDLIAYRFSMGQAKEFSSVLLPTLMPTQAYVDFNSSSAMDWDPHSRLTMRFGLFTPTFNPWWSPDLSDVPLPDFNESHKALFLGRDVGAELLLEPIVGRLQFHVGMFNGSGIFATNTNNARAFTAGVQGSIFMGGTKWTMGLSALLRDQADPTNVNFRSDAIGNLFSSLEFAGSNFKLTGELFGGALNDTTRSAQPFGGAGALYVPLIPGVRLFARAEVLRGTGVGTGFLRNGQFGPILDLHKSTQTYVFYQYLDTGGSIEHMGWVRVRLNI
jgi:hypothetical protein